MIRVLKGDITEADADAVVNAANTDLMLGSGVAGAIRKKGGPSIQKECDEIARIELGEAAATSAGNLKAKYVIHAASMRLGGETTTESLANSVKNSLRVAEGLKLKSIAFPAIGCGVGGFPPERAAKIMIAEARNFLKTAINIKEIQFILFDDETLKVFQKETT